jgi:hypothetical protein
VQATYSSFEVYGGRESREILRKICGELDDLEDFLEVCEKEQIEEKKKLEEAKVFA